MKSPSLNPSCLLGLYRSCREWHGLSVRAAKKKAVFPEAVAVKSNGFTLKVAWMYSAYLLCKSEKKKTCPDSEPREKVRGSPTSLESSSPVGLTDYLLRLPVRGIQQGSNENSTLLQTHFSPALQKMKHWDRAELRKEKVCQYLFPSHQNETFFSPS